MLKGTNYNFRKCNTRDIFFFPCFELTWILGLPLNESDVRNCIEFLSAKYPISI